MKKEPRRSRTINIKDSLYDSIKEVSDENGESFSSQLEMILNEYLKNLEDKK